MDIGFGCGETSLYLASHGHTVHAIEPSPLHCEILQASAKKYGLDSLIKTYQGPAENFDQIKEENFDLCLFNASLHNCDDPLGVLRICKQKLKKQGRVLALNEPILKFYRTKKWYHKTLQEDPVSLGHYGGNEHIYYHHEYVDMLKKANLIVKDRFHIRHFYPRAVIKHNIDATVNGHYTYPDKKLWLKFTILLIVKSLLSNNITKKITISLGRRLSLFAFTFEGTA